MTITAQESVGGLWLLVSVLLGAGIASAVYSHDGHWVDKSGKLIVASSFLLSYVQFRFEATHSTDVNISSRALEARGAVGSEAREIAERAKTRRRSFIEDSRATLLKHTLLAATAGELVSAFGADIFHLVVEALG